MRIGRHRSKRKYIHDMAEPRASNVGGPSNVFVSRAQIDYRVAQTKNANQLPILVINNEVPKSPAVARRHRNAPMETGVAEEQFVKGIRSDANKLCGYASRVDVRPACDSCQQVRLEPTKAVS